MALLLSLLVAGCSRTATHEVSGEYNAIERTGSATFAENTTASNEGITAYDGTRVAKVVEGNTTTERGMGDFYVDQAYGSEGWYAAAFYFPQNTFYGSSPRQKGDIDILRWDNERAFGAASANFGGIRLGRDHRARLVYGAGSGQPAQIGEQFALREGCWNWIAVRQKSDTNSGINEVWLNGKRLISQAGPNIDEARIVSDVKFGYSTNDADQQAGASPASPLTYYVDDATIASSDLPPTGASGANVCGPFPNVLMVVTDDERAISSANRAAWMPNVTSLFANGGRTASNSYATTPECCPSRASIMTGQFPHNHHVESVSVNACADETAPTCIYNKDGTFQKATLARYLKDLGYTTGIFGKYLNKWNLDKDPPYFDHFAVSNTGAAYCSFEVREEGNPPTRVQHGVGTLDNSLLMVDPGPTFDDYCFHPTPAGYSTTYFGEKAVDFLQNAETLDGRPWFLYLALHAPHATTEVTAPPGRAGTASKFVPDQNFHSFAPTTPAGSAAFEEPEVSDKPPYVQHSKLAATSPSDPEAYPCCAFPTYPTPPVQQDRRLDQMRTLASVDAIVSQVFQGLDSDENNDTLAFYTSDNGYLWDEHWLEGKLAPYTYSVKVPLYMRWPHGGIAGGGAADNRLLANIDIAPTVVDALSPSISPNPEMDGRSWLGAYARSELLLEYTHSDGDDEPAAACELPSWAALRTLHWQYTRYEQLDDPDCHPPGGYHKPVFREFYGEESAPFTNEITIMSNNLYGGNGVYDPPGSPNPDVGAPDSGPKDTELDRVRSCAGTSGLNAPACP